jgi:hypothetical protein
VNPIACEIDRSGKLSFVQHLNYGFRDVRRVGVRACLPACTEPSLFCYHHVNRSFHSGGGLFDPGVLVARPLFLLSCGAAINQPESPFLILLVEAGLIHHRVNPYVCCVLDGDESVE